MSKHEQREGWLARRNRSPKFVKASLCEDYAETFIAGIECLMESQGVSRKQLATKIGCSPANITRTMKHSTNMTIGTMVDMAFALGHKVSPTLEPLEHRSPVQRATHLHIVTGECPVDTEWNEDITPDEALA